MSFLDTALRTVGLQRITADTTAPFDGASRNRLNVDWAISILSADQEVRTSLRNMRSRCRQLANNNDYAIHFLNKATENVIGSHGIRLQMTLDPAEVPGAQDLNQAVEDAWSRWCESPAADGRMTWMDTLELALRTQLQDGELFLRKLKGYPFNPCHFAVQFVDADQVDVMFQRLRRPDDPTQPNEIRMGVELDEWRRPVAYHMFQGHPSEMAGVVRIRVPANQMEHAFVFRRVNQTRGIPWMHTAMTRMHMLAGYEEAELVGARLEACKMGYYVSKTGDEYPGARPVNQGPIETVVEPGTWKQLPEGVEPKMVDWQHPNGAFPEFTRAMLRGASAGLNCSYATLSNDLRDVNFSSLRQGVLDERRGWKSLQTFARDHIVRPVFADWLPMAVLAGQLEVPARMPLDLLLEAARWTAPGWDWVDPLKDSTADIMAIRSCTSTLASRCATKGEDWRDNIDQRAREIEYARSKGVPIDLTTSGSGGVEGDTGEDEPQRGVPPVNTKPAPKQPPQPPGGKPNGTGALEAYDDQHLVRLPQ